MQTQKRNFNPKGAGLLAMQLLFDAAMVNVSFLVSLYLRYDMQVPPVQLARYGRIWPIMTALCLIAFAATHMYKRLWRYASVDEGLAIVVGTFSGMGATFVFALIAYTIQPDPNLFMNSRPVYLIAWLLLMILTATQRFSIRLFNQLGVSKRAIGKGRRRRVMIVGAGWAGASTIRQMIARGYREGMPVVVVDDDKLKAGTRINRVPVRCGVVNIPEYAKQYQIDDIVVAIPSASPAQMRAIMQACTSTSCKLKMVPTMKDLSGGKDTIGEMRDVNIADLLCREEVKLDLAAISGYLTGRTVLVTGGGGSIGSELCRQIARFSPKELVVFDIYENNAYELSQELKARYGDSLKLTVLIGSVRDEKRLKDVFDAVRPEVVFHAAAHKHVPLMEDSPAEAVKNNIFGTLNVAREADRHGVDRFVILSTDKAVNPTNVMGATKRATEKVIQYMARHSKTRFMAVRFGNVLGSNGSVIPLFRQQIQRGGPVTVTHPDITRYFMTIPEAAQLVLEAGSIGESGSIFVLDMGTPVKIVDLAKNLIQLSGFTPDEEIKIEYCGLRPGEKLYEELTMAEESDRIEKTCHDKITVVRPTPMDDQQFLQDLEALRSCAAEEPARIREPLIRLVPSFRQKLKKVG